MKIAFYSTKPYDKIYFEEYAKEYGQEIHFIESACTKETLVLAKDAQAICVFVNDYINAEMIDILHKMGIKGILLRCAGFNQIDLKAAKDKMMILRVPSYSPEAVAEFAMAMILTVNRMTHKAYNRTRDFNMSLQGLMGMDLHGKTAGIVGTGKIGQAMIRICEGFGMRILAYDPYPNASLRVSYVSLETLMQESDVISLHCPLTPETRYLINKESIGQMKKGVYLVNTSRGDLIDTQALLDGLLDHRFGGVGLDVYEEEEGLYYEDRSGQIMQDQVLARLTTFPNVLITSHMGFFTREAMQEIARVTLENASKLEKGEKSENQV